MAYGEIGVTVRMSQSPLLQPQRATDDLTLPPMGVRTFPAATWSRGPVVSGLCQTSNQSQFPGNGSLRSLPSAGAEDVTRTDPTDGAFHRGTLSV